MKRQLLPFYGSSHKYLCCGGIFAPDSQNFFGRDLSERSIETASLQLWQGPGNRVFREMAARATLAAPFGLAMDSHGNLPIADSSNLRVRSVSPAGTISTIAGGRIFPKYLSESE
jgi:hypothetical protein